MSAVGPVLAIAGLSFRTSLRGIRVLALAAFAAIPSLLVVALAAAHVGPTTIARDAQALYVDLTLPIVVIVVLLILAVAQFRNEIDDDTLSYLTSRSIPRAGIVLGKYLGCVAGGILLLVPAALGPVAVAGLAGAPAPASSVLVALTAMTVLASAAYAALFLTLGLLTPWALLYGLIYGFLWEELLPLLSGSAPLLTIKFYVRSVASDLVPSGPLAHLSQAVGLDGAVAAPLLAAVAFLLTAMVVIRYVELVPERTSA